MTAAGMSAPVAPQLSHRAGVSTAMARGKGHAKEPRSLQAVHSIEKVAAQKHPSTPVFILYPRPLRLHLGLGCKQVEGDALDRSTD